MNSLHRALAILNFIGSREMPVSPRQIAAALHIPLSTVYRLLNILKLWELVSHAKTYGTYTVGAQSLKTANPYRRHSLPAARLRPLTEALAKECGETVAVVVCNLYETICVDIIEAERTLRCSFEAGKSNTLLRGASGKTFLAFCSPQHRNLALQMPAHRLDDTGRERLLRELAHIRRQGFGTSTGEIDEGVFGVSAPVFYR
ncbi:IclR family transcriptional regulator [Neisseria leonii]|uniref:IclR family transcriptional regulator n=1 Tax=Neisseria leonii TaxID=2995413 RepID=UPI00237B131A|nr:IclR family transcriptional regulator [Neisseria sp. 3986]MDD9325024.1 IclR family transcriptional regulator [Neisseria sp. 3986]